MANRSANETSGWTASRVLPASLVGSYPQPDWLIDRRGLAGQTPPRVRMRELWRVPSEWLTEAQDDAVRLTVRDQEAAGLDIVTDGEVRRESYSNLFSTALEGLDLERLGTATSRTGRTVPVPRVVGPIRRRHAVNTEAVRFLRSQTTRALKVTIPGPFTMTQLADNHYYASEADMAMDYAVAVNDEMADLFAAGADIVQIDEPYLQARPDRADDYGLAVLSRALDGATGTTALHTCFGYAAIVKERPRGGYPFLTQLSTVPVDHVSVEAAQPDLDCSTLSALADKTIVLGVIDLSTETIETPDVIATRIRRALPHVEAARLIVAPDCGMKYLTRAAAYGKMAAMVEGASLVREEIGLC
jgi:5-methyltetrahydropteroyltriglutamate--homocysteine methyltransferase